MLRIAVGYKISASTLGAPRSSGCPPKRVETPSVAKRSLVQIRGLPPTGLVQKRNVRGHNLSQCCRAAPWDAEEDEYDIDYDSDDYELLEAAVAAPRSASTQPPSAAGPASVSYDFSSSSGRNSSQQQQRETGASKKPHSTRRAIRSGFNIFLLFGAAVDRFVSRIQAAMLAVVRGVAAAIATFFWRSPAGRATRNLQRNVKEVQSELPDDTWGKLLWLWDRPPMQRLRLTVSMANLSFRLPALMALVATQVGLLASQVSLPMLAPLLLGTGMLLRSIKSNASFLFPRIGVLVVMLWILWFANSVVQNTVAYLRKQGALDNRLAGGIITVSECTTLLIAMVVMLTMLGVNVSALLLPAGIAVAIAAKDLSHNFLAGFFLFVVQPFKLGDRLAVPSSAAGASMGGYAAAAPGSSAGPAWFEGICEKVDLRYTVVRQGRRRLVIPNSAFLTREFMVVDEGPVPEPPLPPPPGGSSNEPQNLQQFMTTDNRHVWQYVQGPPVHQELLANSAAAGVMGGVGGGQGVPQSVPATAVNGASSTLQHHQQHHHQAPVQGGESHSGSVNGQSRNTTNGKTPLNGNGIPSSSPAASTPVAAPATSGSSNTSTSASNNNNNNGGGGGHAAYPSVYQSNLHPHQPSQHGPQYHPQPPPQQMPPPPQQQQQHQQHQGGPYYYNSLGTAPSHHGHHHSGHHHHNNNNNTNGHFGYYAPHTASTPAAPLYSHPLSPEAWSQENKGSNSNHEQSP